MQKLVLMVRNAYAFDFGGGERFSVDHSLVLQRLGYRTVVISHSPMLLSHARKHGLAVRKGLWWNRQDWGGLRVVLMPVYLLWQAVLYVWYLLLFARLRPSAVHLQSRDDFIAGTLAARTLRIKTVWTDHADLKYIFANYKVWYKNPIGKLVFACSRLAHHVTLVSQSEKKLIEASLGRAVPAHYTVIHNGVESGEVSLIKRNPKHRHDVIFGCSSRLVTAKGIGELIQAFERVRLKQPKCRLYLFGEGPEEARFRKLAAKDSRIHFLGFPANALGQLADCDIFVHPSYHEGFSISLVEAAKLGLPIIACNTGGNPEIVRDNTNGLLIPVKDIKALANAMLTLAQDQKKRQVFGAAGQRIYRQEFVLEDLIKDRFVPLYE